MAGGSVVADGKYILIFDYQDACGNRDREDLVVTVDATAPDAGIDYPKAGDPLTSIIEVLISTDDVHFRNFVLELGQGTDPETWVQLAAGAFHTCGSGYV